MIRDPSDGSIKEQPKLEAPQAPTLMDDERKPDLSKRLETSREWLKNYRKQRG